MEWLFAEREAWIKVVWRALKRWRDLGAQKKIGNTSLPQGPQTKPFSFLPRGEDRIQISKRCLLNEPNFCHPTQKTHHMFSTNTASLPKQRLGKANHPILTAGTWEGSREGQLGTADKTPAHKTKDS